MGIIGDRQEQRPRRNVEYIDILSDDGDKEELSNTYNGESSAESAVILQKPSLCNRSADSDGCVQRDYNRGWYCESCTFRNSSMVALSCAVCGIERVF